MPEGALSGENALEPADIWGEPVKRVYLVGKSRDNKRLLFARTKGAKRGSLEVPISKKLLKLVREAEEAEQRADEAAEPAEVAGDGEGAIADDGGPRRRVDLAPDSKLTPAEIQALLREGRGVRAVARQAEAPVEWVQRLAQPIESERVGVVAQLLRTYLVRPRKGRSSQPVGVAIVENLRDKGVRFPERVVEEGWTVTRSEGRDWRVRFAFESRGRRQRADWQFDPQTREAEPLNHLAADIAFREPDGRPEEAVSTVDVDSIRPTTRSPGASGRVAGEPGSSERGPSARGGPRKKSGARKKPGSRKSGSRKRSGGTRKKPGSRKKSAPRKKSASTRKKPASRKKAASRGRTSRGKRSSGRSPRKRSSGRS